MTTTELQTTRVTDDEVVAWRFEQLLRAGCERAGAEILARRVRVDLHQAVELLERGCPTRFALAILL
jgi:plasmid stabilization system protein ParE